MYTQVMSAALAPPLSASLVDIGTRLLAQAHHLSCKWWKLSNKQLNDEVNDKMEDANAGSKMYYSVTALAESMSLQRPCVV